MTDQASGPAFWDLAQYKSDTVASTVVEERRTRKLRARFEGNGMSLFGLALGTVMRTILTVGLYRFWMITRLRRWYWTAIVIDGDPLEYSGSGLEKMMGFLVALVFLAIYLGAINLGLAFAGLSVASDEPFVLEATLQLSALATLPFIFFGIYKGQQYMLNRTSWRGIRFGLDQGAWGYTWRALLYSLLTLVTAGLAYPYQHFKLAKYVTDRASFGDQKFHQGGRWGDLFAQWIWIYIFAGVCAIIIWGVIENPQDLMSAFLGWVVASFGVTGLLLAYQRYRVAAFKILWADRTLGEARFDNDLSPGRVLGIYIGGNLATGLAVGAAGFLIMTVLGAVIGGLSIGISLTDLESLGEEETAAAGWVGFGVVGFLYLLLFGMAFAFSLVFVSMRVLKAKVEGMQVIGPEFLNDTRQRDREAAGEAGGFADALGVDLGAGI